jgi:hypothetical protein
MDNNSCPEIDNFQTLNNLTEQEIRQYLTFCKEENKVTFLNFLKESNDCLQEKSKENKIKIEKLEKLNKILLKKTVSCIENNDKEKDTFYNEILSELSNKNIFCL